MPYRAKVVGAGARVAAPEARDPDPFENRDQLRAVAPLAGGDQLGRPLSPARWILQVRPPPADPFVGAVLPRRRSSLRSPRRSPRGPRPRAGGPGARSSRRSPCSSRPAPEHPHQPGRPERSGPGAVRRPSAMALVDRPDRVAIRAAPLCRPEGRRPDAYRPACRRAQRSMRARTGGRVPRPRTQR